MACTAHLVVNDSCVSYCQNNIGSLSKHINSPSLTTLLTHLPCWPICLVLCLLLALALVKMYFLSTNMTLAMCFSWISMIILKYRLIMACTARLVANHNCVSDCQNNIGSLSGHINSPSWTTLSTCLPHWPICLVLCLLLMLALVKVYFFAYQYILSNLLFLDIYDVDK